jgi:hypothetical protein
MKNFLRFLSLVVGFGLAGNVRADDGVLTPDGYMGHPAFEIGVNGSPSGDSFTESYNYTNYAIMGNVTGNSNFNNNRVFLNIYYPMSETFTLALGGSYLFNATGSATIQGTANNFTGTENGTYSYTYPNTLSWFVSMKIYTK